MIQNSSESRLVRVEKHVTLLRIICASQLLALIFVAWLFSDRTHVQASGADKVLHVKGLVIEDAQGRARVLLGAPFPTVKDRLRQDDATTSMIFLDEKGHDRLTLGEEPTPQIGGRVPSGYHRVAPGVGMLIHDDQGNERGGMGWLGNGRIAIALDRPGLDAIGAYVDDHSGFAGMVVEYPKEVANDVNAIEIGTQKKQAFLRFKGVDDKVKATVSLEDGSPIFSGFSASDDS